MFIFFFFSSRRRHTRYWRDWSSDVCSSDLIGHTNRVIGVSFSPDGKILASTSADNTVKLWDTATLKEIKTLIGHTNRVDRKSVVVGKECRSRWSPYH